MLHLHSVTKLAKCALATCFVAALLGNSAYAQNKLSNQQKQQHWQQLFDGKTTSGWHTYLKNTAGDAWTVVDGAIQLNPSAKERGDLVTNNEYENFELSVEWKISPEGNSGIIFGIHEDTTYHSTYDTGIEMQVLDNEKAEDNKKASHLAGSLYDMQQPSVQAAKPAGEWNVAKIMKNKGHLTFWLNNKEIINVQMGSEQWQNLLNNSKFKTWKGFAAYPKGKIALQDHGHVVAFKNIMIRQL